MIPLPIANGLYNDRSLPISHQLCKNWYPSIVQTEGLSQQVLYGTPGLSQIASAGGTSRINRGSHTKNGIPFFVNGDRFYRMDKTTPLGVDTFSLTDEGLLSGNTRVSMADNGTQLMTVSEGIGYIYEEGQGDWVSRTTPVDNDWNGIAFGEDVFVSIANSGTGDRVMTSPDGIEWTSRSSAADLDWRAVTYGDGLFVAVGASGTGNRVMTSTDGITWTSRTSAADNAWTAVTYGNGLYVAVSVTGTGNRVMTSPDGINWTSRTSAADNSWASIAYGNGVFVAVSSNGTNNRVMTSPDGITWSSQNAAAEISWFAVTFGNGLFVAVARDLSNNIIMTSADGITWVGRPGAAARQWEGIAYGAGLYVACDSIAGDVMSSYDTIDWELHAAINDNDYMAIAFGNSTFAAVSNTGTLNRAMTSAGRDLVQISDTDFYANGTPSKVRFVDGYFVVTTDEKKFIRSAANDGLNWNALDYGSAEADPDNIQALEIDNNDVYILGTETIEPFDNIGGGGFGFQRSGLVFNKGTIAPNSVLKTTDGIAFLGGGKDESPAFWSLTGNNLVKISHPGIDNHLNTLSLEELESCFALYYSEAGAFFISFTFPSITFVYDFASKLWHQRESSGLRWRVNSLTTAYARLLAGDAIDGRIGEMNLDIYTEYGNYIEAQVASPNFSNQGERAFYPKIEATMEAGVGNADTPAPTLTFDYSDNGKTFTGARSREVGKIGQFNKRTIWRRNGSASRYRTNRFTYTGKTKRTFIKLEAEIEA